VAELERKMEVEKALVIEILKDSQKGNKLMADGGEIIITDKK